MNAVPLNIPLFQIFPQLSLRIGLLVLTRPAPPVISAREPGPHRPARHLNAAPSRKSIAHYLEKISVDSSSGDSEHLANVRGTDSFAFEFLGPGSGNVIYFAGSSTVAVVGRGRSEAGPGAFDHRVAFQLRECGHNRFLAGEFKAYPGYLRLKGCSGAEQDGVPLVDGDAAPFALGGAGRAHGAIHVCRHRVRPSVTTSPHLPD